MKIHLSLLFACLMSISGTAQIISTFDTDADGWTFSNNGTPITVNHSASNGNPGGYVATAPYASNTSVSSQGWFAPAKFLGPQALRSYGMNLHFDLQQAFAGTNSSVQGDVRIETTTNDDIVFSLPVKPAVAPAWSSYTIKLDETGGWRLLSASGALATQADILRALSNVKTIEIRGTYITNAANVIGLDNVILEQKTLDIAPAVTSFAPLSGIPGASVTINGNNFGATAALNAVYFGTTKATITSGNPTQLTVTIPAGAQFGPITIINLTTGLSKQSNQSFLPLFDNNKDFGGRIIPSSFDLKDELSILSAGATGLDLGDLDGDGLVDIIVTEIQSSPTAIDQVSVFRNLGVTSDINASSFTAKIVLGQGAEDCSAVDLDGDGKLDIVGHYSSGFTHYFITYRNISTPGNISFEAPESFVDAGNIGALHVADLDGDGRPDLLGTHPSSGLFSYFYISQNLSVPGDILFGAVVAPHPIITSSREISTGDLTGDGKLDIVVSNGGAFRLFQNQSTPGTIILATPVLIDPTNNVTNVEIADLDNDGKLDLSWASGVAASAIRIRKNIYSGGVLDESSFDPEVVITSPAYAPTFLTIADINGDGKLDMVTTNVVNLGIFENVFSGTLNSSSFRAPVQFQGTTFNTNPLQPVIADLDGDNKPDVVTATTGSPYQVSIFRNTCFPTPIINSITPVTGEVGISFTLSGNFMNTALEPPNVKVGFTSATSGVVSNTSVSATIPTGATSGRVSVNLHGLTTFSKPLNVTFPTSRAINASSFTAPIEFALTNAFVDFTVGADNLTVADFDNDGKTDVVVNDNNTFRIFRNTVASNGDAIDVASLTSIATTYTGTARLAATDIDGDGKPDLIASSFIYRNNSGTTTDAISFEPSVQHIISGTTGLLAGHDFNHDGKSDFAHTGGNLYQVEENASRKGAFTFVGGGVFSTIVNSSISAAAGGQPEKIIADDFDGDGYDDLAFGVNAGADFLSVVRNTGLNLPLGPAQFETALTFPALDLPWSIASADFDGDGKTDIVLGNNNAAFISIYKNTSTAGSISFLAKQDIAALTRASEVKAVDLDGDGKAEIIVAHKPTTTTGSFTIFQNTSTAGTISFAAGINYPLTRAPLSLAIADINLDTKPDLIFTTNGTTDALMIFENKISEPIPTITSFSPSSGPVGTTVTITGTNFSSIPTENIVYFGATQATVSASTVTQLTVTVPVGATYHPITVMVNGLIAYSSTFFKPAFTGILSFSSCSTLQLLTNTFPSSVGIGDFNNDGRPDLVSTNRDNNSVSVLLANGSWGFNAKTDYGTGVKPFAISIAHFNNDNGLDLATVNDNSLSPPNFVSVLLGNGSGDFGMKTDFQTGVSPQSLATGDVNKDGHTDIVVGNSNETTVSVLLGNGDGTFRAKINFTITFGVTSIILIDANGDSNMDIAAANFFNDRISILLGNGAGGFGSATNFTTGAGPNVIASGDFNGDDIIDIVSTNSNANKISVLLGTGTGTFNPKTDYPTGNIPRGVAVGDLSGDGILDIVVTNTTSNTISVLEGNSNGTFDPKVDFTTENNPYAVAIGDLNGDGKNDIAVSNSTSNTLTVFYHTSVPTISSFTPQVGSVGTTVIITGTNFSATPSNNTVNFFNNIPATVTASSSTTITTTVPVGASTGLVSVTVGCNTITSVTNFTVSNALIPSIISFTASSGPIGTVVTITGTNFSTTPDENIVQFNGVTATVTASSSTSITAIVPAGATTGRITVAVAGLTATSDTDFVVTNVNSEIEIFNAVSPNGDDKNPYFRIENIEALEPDNTVTIYNRWGSKVFEVENYSEANAFRGLNQNGNELPSGTYFYKIFFKSTGKTQNGFLVLKR